jgi:hypothetical protein
MQGYADRFKAIRCLAELRTALFVIRGDVSADGYKHIDKRKI